MNLSLGLRTVVYFQLTRSLQRIFSSSVVRTSFEKIRLLRVPQHTRGKHNNMADGSIVQEYAKRAKLAVSAG